MRTILDESNESGDGVLKNKVAGGKRIKYSGEIADILRIAGAYTAYVIGSGFATGQEIVQFFTVHGIYGIAGIFVCAFLFSYIGAELLADGYRYSQTRGKTEIYGAYEYYCGSVLGRMFEILMPVILFCTVVIMIAGAGAAASEYFGLNYRSGCAAMAAVLLVSYMLGFHRMVNAIGFIAPVIIIFMVAVGVITIAKSEIGSFAELFAHLENAFGKMSGETARGAAGAASAAQRQGWLFSALLYASYNTISAVAFFRALGSSAASVRSARAGGILGGIMLMTAAMIINLAVMTKAEIALNLSIPTLYLARTVSPAFGAAFSAVLLTEIFSTAAPMMWTVCSRFGDEGTARSFAAGTVFIISTYILSGFSFEKLIGYVYPCTGILGFLFLFCFACRRLRRKSARSCRCSA